MDTHARITVKFTGHVQGVGFRYTAAHLARNHAVRGYVKNMSDGSVGLVSEGDKKDLESFLEDIKDRMSRHIQNSEVLWSSPTGEFKDFRIKY